MDYRKFIELVQKRVANVCIGATTLRGQPQGTTQIGRNYLINIDLSKFKDNLSDKKKYEDYLNTHTSALQNEIPLKSWGIARKILNLFFRDVVYNIYLAHYLDISNDSEKNKEAIQYLEVPLDSYVMKKLRDILTNGNGFNVNPIPIQTTITELTEENSAAYQEVANLHAKELNIARVHLDLVFWRA